MSRVNSLIRKYEKRLADLPAEDSLNDAAENAAVDSRRKLLREVIRDLIDINRDIDLDELHGAN